MQLTDALQPAVAARQQRAVGRLDPHLDAEPLGVALRQAAQMIGVEQADDSALEFAARRTLGVRQRDRPQPDLVDPPRTDREEPPGLRRAQAPALPAQPQGAEPLAVVEPEADQRRLGCLPHPAGGVGQHHGAQLRQLLHRRHQLGGKAAPLAATRCLLHGKLDRLRDARDLVGQGVG